MTDNTEKTFVDTNILVYAHDLLAKEKQKSAAEKIKKLWADNSGVVSLQVLQELFVTLTQKISNPLPQKTAKEIVKQYTAWEVVIPDTLDLFMAIDFQKKYHFSFWDSLIVQTTLKAKCKILLSEDFQSGQLIEELTIKNPFVDF
jgi:predicted nucleic acid-binding protein